MDERTAGAAYRPNRQHLVGAGPAVARYLDLVARATSGDQVAFHFRFRSGDGERTSVIEPIDVMTFDEDGLITSMRAFWSRSDVRLA